MVGTWQFRTDNTMTNELKATGKIELPSVEQIQQELSSAMSIHDFFGKEASLRDCLQRRFSPMVI